MSWFRRQPISFGFFYLTLIVFLLQVFPYTGIFLMIVGGAFWSVIFINAGMLALIVEAALGRVSRLWLLAPLIWFGGYAGLHLLSQRQLSGLQEELVTHNASQKLAFAAGHESLVLENASYVISASDLVQNYAIAAAYEKSREARERVSRLSLNEDCRRLSGDPAAQGAGVSTFWFHEDFGKGRRLVPGLCTISGPENGKSQRVTVVAERRSVPGFLLPHERITLTVRRSEGGAITLLAATAHPLKRFPMPVLGCALNSGAPSWNCFAQFMRDGYQRLGATDGGGTTSILAGAIGLRRSPASERRESVSPQDTAAMIDGIVAARAAENLAAVVDSFTNPARRLTVHDVSTLRSRPELYAAHVPSIIETIDRSLRKPAPIPRGNRVNPADANRYQPETARSLQLLLLGLSQESGLAPIRRIMGMLAENAALEPAMVAPELALRLGDFGAEAVPLLERLAFHGGRPNMMAAIQGLCRIGAPAAHLAERLASELDRKRSRSSSERRLAAYIAILRFGRPDIADLDSDQDSQYQRSTYERLRQTVTPQSDPAVCLEQR